MSTQQPKDATEAGGYGRGKVTSITVAKADRAAKQAKSEAAPKSIAAVAADAPADATTEPGTGPTPDLEIDVARRLVDVHGSEIRYAAGIEWLTWTGTRWAIDLREHARELVKLLAEELRTTAAADDDDDLWTLAKACGRARGLSGILDAARSDPRVRVAVDQLDGDPWVLNAANGTIDLTLDEHPSAALDPHDRADLLTKITPVAYDPNARAPLFERFLEEVQPDPEVRAYLARLFGYAACGVVREKVLGVFWGKGDNGKSVLAECVMQALGDYAKPGPSSLIVQNGHHEPHPTDVATCVGARLVVVHETKKGASFDASKVKLLTGGDRLTARFMRQDFFSFAPTHTLLMLSNYKPAADGSDAALWTRVQLVPFSVVIPKAKQDRSLTARIVANELPGVLRWIVDGAREWQRLGLAPPEVVREQTEAYRTSEDTIAAFIEERCVTTVATARIAASALYENFRTWCEAQGARPARANDFGAEIEARGFRRTRQASGRFYEGIGLRSVVDDDDRSRSGW